MCLRLLLYIEPSMSLLYNDESTGLVYYRPISDVSSDLTIEVGASSFALHKVKETNCVSDGCGIFSLIFLDIVVLRYILLFQINLFTFYQSCL